MLAAITQTPELALTDAEGERLAEAMANATRHMNLPALSPQKMALGMLFWTVGSIYVPKAMAIRARQSGYIPAQMPVKPAGAEQTPPAAQNGQIIDPAAPSGSWLFPDPSVIN